MSRAQRKRRLRKARRDEAKKLRQLITKTEEALVNGDGLDWLRAVKQDEIDGVIESLDGKLWQFLYRSTGPPSLIITSVYPIEGTITLSDAAKTCDKPTR
jgi:hypothetical protein